MPRRWRSSWTRWSECCHRQITVRDAYRMPMSPAAPGRARSDGLELSELIFARHKLGGSRSWPCYSRPRRLCSVSVRVINPAAAAVRMTYCTTLGFKYRMQEPTVRVGQVCACPYGDQGYHRAVITGVRPAPEPVRVRTVRPASLSRSGAAGVGNVSRLCSVAGSFPDLPVTAAYHYQTRKSRCISTQHSHGVTLGATQHMSNQIN